MVDHLPSFLWQQLILRLYPSACAGEPSALGRLPLLRESSLWYSGLLDVCRLAQTPIDATVPPVTRIIGHHDAANQDKYSLSGRFIIINLCLGYFQNFGSLPWSHVRLNFEDADDAISTNAYFIVVELVSWVYVR